MARRQVPSPKAAKVKLLLNRWSLFGLLLIILYAAIVPLPRLAIVKFHVVISFVLVALAVSVVTFGFSGRHQPRLPEQLGQQYAINS